MKMSQKPISRASLIALAMLLIAGMLLILIAHIELQEYEEAEREARTSQPADVSNPGSTGSPESADPSSIFEDATDLHNLDAHGSYDNTRKLECELGYGIRMYLGAETSAEINGVCLSPRLEYDYAINEDERYIFLIRCSRGALEYSGTPSAYDSQQNAAFTSLLLDGRTYDLLTPATYVNPDAFGVLWFNDITGDSWDRTGAELYIHAIRLKDGSLMGAAKAVIEYDENEEFYYLDSVSKADVCDRNELTEAERTALIDAAVTFFNSGKGQIYLTISDSDRANLAAFYVVETRQRPLYNKLFNVNAEVIPAGRIAGCDLIAVHIPYIGFGYLTAYFASETDARGLARYKDDGTDYVLIAFEAVNSPPFDADTFNSFLIPEDAKKFNVN